MIPGRNLGPGPGGELGTEEIHGPGPGPGGDTVTGEDPGPGPGGDPVTGEARNGASPGSDESQGTGDG